MRAICLLLVLLPVAGIVSQTRSRAPITALAVHPDSGDVLAGSQSGVRQLTSNLESAESVRSEVEAVHELAFAPRGRALAVAGGRPAQFGRVTVLPWPVGEPSVELDIGDDVAFDIAWSPDETRLAVASLDGMFRMIDVQGGKVVLELHGHSRGVTGVCFVNDEGHVATASLDHTVRIWDSTNGELLRTLNLHSGPVYAVTAQPKDSADSPDVIVSVSEDRSVRFWRRERGQFAIGRMVRFARLDTVPLCAVWVSPTHVAVGCRDGTVRLVDYETVEAQIVPGETGTVPVHSIARRLDQSVVAGDAAGVLRRFRLP